MDFLRSRPTRLAAVAAALAIGVGLTGCSGSEGSADPSASASASAVAPAAQVSSLDGITVEGEYGTEPTVTFEPFSIDETRSEVLSEGDGPAVEADDTVKVKYFGVNGRTGVPFDTSFPNPDPVPFPLDAVVPGFAEGLVGKTQGSRVLIAMPGEAGYDSAGGSPQAGIEVGDTLVFVVDIVGLQLDAPEGETVSQPGGQPRITGDVGDPQVEIPAGDPPTELLAQPLIKGEGPALTADSTATFNYRAWLWDGTQIDDTYATAPEPGQLSLLIPGWVEGLEGQTVGSRVLLVVPPDLAYPDGVPEASVPAGSTIVYVVDILDAA
jgi:peptidylprolyl isomerase